MHVYNEADDVVYDLHESLPRGGEGPVWRATQRGVSGTPLPVALKILDADSYFRQQIDPAEVLSRWRQQAEILRHFAHEAFVPIQAVFPVSDRSDVDSALIGAPAIAIAWVEGPTFRQWAKSVADPLDRLEALGGCARGLDRFHEQTNYIHRDLKPDNVIVEGGRDARIIDFGLLRDRTLQRQGSLVFGTPGYVAPELLGGAEYSAHTDLYAFAGVIYYALLVEDPPTELGPGRLQTIRKRVAGAGYTALASVMAGYFSSPSPDVNGDVDAQGMLASVSNVVRRRSTHDHPGIRTLADRPTVPMTEGPAPPRPTQTLPPVPLRVPGPDPRRVAIVGFSVFLIVLVFILLATQAVTH